MHKLHNFFLYNFLIIYLSTFLIISIIGYFTLQTIFLDQMKDELKLSVALSSKLLTHAKNFNKFVNNIKKITNDRVTIISSNGTILAESNFNKIKILNYKNRPELLQAKKVKYGLSIRNSKTINKKFLYLAKYIKYKHKYLYLRIAKNLTVFYHEFFILYTKIISIFLLFAVIGLIITYKMSKKVKYDIDQITDYLSKIADKEYKSVIKTKYFNEFLYISLLLKNLVKKLASREKKKNKYNAKLRLINKQRNDILSAISHEFKNPIAAIVGYTQTIREDENININIRNRFLDKILSNAQKISNMIDRLTLSIKLENNNFTITSVVFNIADICRDVKNALEIKYKNRNIILNIQTCNILSDKTMLELVIMNLVDNALKYSEDDVEISLKNNFLSVNDHGIGFNKNQIDKITTKFYRVRTNNWDNSMGLGLAIVTYILRLNNLKLIITSEPNVGSSFGFDISSIVT